MQQRQPSDSKHQAYKAVGESTVIPLTYYANNVGATINLLQIMEEYDCPRMVYSSSATVYGTPPEIPIPESTRLKADSPYGKTKVMCETILEDLCAGKSSSEIIDCLRFTSLFSLPRTMEVDFSQILQVRVC